MCQYGVKEVALLDNEGKRVISFLKKNILARFSTPRESISDGGLYFCTKVFYTFLKSMQLLNMKCLSLIIHKPFVKGRYQLEKIVLAKIVRSTLTD